jgi:CTP synthase
VNSILKEQRMSVKYIFVTGGVVSSLGKGLASASMGALLESRGLTVTLQKLDPYINIDPGTMSPFQHGEVYVTDDGTETDLDLGHYERYTNAKLNKNSNYTTGKIYNSVIQKERRGDYLGGTVQVVPHITNEIKESIKSVAHDVDVVIAEIGGTIGDIESLPFLEAIRQFRQDVGRRNVIYVHLTLVPYIRAAGELKSKPTQHSVKELLQIGIQPDILLCRTEHVLPEDLKKKIALFCNVDHDAVISARDVETIYEVPLFLHREGLDDKIVELLDIKNGKQDLSEWEEIVEKIKHPTYNTTIGIVGKYIDLRESYKSLNEALTHGGAANDARVNIKWVEAEEIERYGPQDLLKDVDGVLVPGGFGERGIEGKIAAIEYARTRKVPFLGICLGMQCAVIEYARNVCGLPEANSTEFDLSTPDPVIYLLEKWTDFKDNTVQERDIDSNKGGTMRLGAYPCVLNEGSFSAEAYGSRKISERHRHRYEFNNRYLDRLKENGLVIAGKSPDGKLVEIVEVADHPWFVGCQFHPEFKSRPRSPHPLFRDFVKASLHFRQHTGGKKKPSGEIRDTMKSKERE